MKIFWKLKRDEIEMNDNASWKSLVLFPSTRNNGDSHGDIETISTSEEKSK